MSVKRSRAAFEADLTAQQSPFAFFGTPLPPLDPDVRDDGSYVPVWKQEVRDERGRKRFHGAFTGGFSAGYFNTVGSKEGWTPSTFVSSRTNRRKDDPKASQQRPEDFMDEEDLNDAEEAKKIQTNASFAGLGSTNDDAVRLRGLMGLFKVEGDTMGTKLLRKMGWKDGQGVGPKIRRSARLGLKDDSSGSAGTHLFAPENIPMVKLDRKSNRKGLGFEGEGKLTSMGPPPRPKRAIYQDEDDDDDGDTLTLGRPKISTAAASKQKPVKGSIGMGVLNDAGSDDDDPYEMGPRISYNKVIVAERKKKKTSPSINPNIKATPKFISSKKLALAKVGLGARKCHDGRLPPDGFVFGKDTDSLTSSINGEGKYPPPKIPADWKSSKQKTDNATQHSATYVSTADAAKASSLDPKARAALLGEKQLPGKSVFDFMSESARARLAEATGKSNLPAAKGEIPAEFARTEEEKLATVLEQAPKLEKETAAAALSRGLSTGGPYADDEEKRSRYRGFLDYHAGFGKALPPKPTRMKPDEWLRELQEFFNCARMFKPMTGFMASRFTTSSSTTTPSTGSRPEAGDDGLLTKPAAKPQDPAEEAAKLGMYGPMTRSVADFYPTRLLCKRFGVPPPAHVQPDQDAASSNSRKDGISRFDLFGGIDLIRPPTMPSGSRQELIGSAQSLEEDGKLSKGKGPLEVVVDSTRNDALECTRPGEDVFKAIFGDGNDDN